VAERIDLAEAPMPAARRAGQKGGGRGPKFTKLEDFARRVFAFALPISLLLLLYLLGGLWSGVWSHEQMGLLTQARRQQQLENIALVFHLLEGTTLVSLVSLLVICARTEGVGYWLLGMAAFFYAGASWVTTQFFWVRHQTPSNASSTILTDFQALGWLFAAPGIVWSVIDLARRFGEAAQMAAIQRATAKYGAGVHKQATPGSKQRQVFLGRCWEGPFCRDNIRVKCPIYLRKRGPCWWYKEGCMCEERIVLQAMISSDWKEKSAEARKSLETGAPRKLLSPEAKRERCRSCVIYNEHQRQKHKALTVAVLIGVPAVLVWQFAWLQKVVNQLLFGLDAATKRFAFTNDPAGITALHNGAYSLIAWVFIVCGGVILLSQALKMIEYFCFKLKI